MGETETIMEKRRTFSVYEIVIMGVMFLAYFFYCMYLTVEVPSSTVFDFLPIIDKYYTGTLQFSDFLTTYGEHGMLGYNFVFLFNAIVFDLSMSFDTWVNFVLVSASAFLFLWGIKKSLTDTKGFFYKFAVLVLAILCFSLIQGGSSIMDTQVRLGLFCFLLQAYMVSKALLEPVSGKYMVVLVLLTFLTVNFFGTMYSFGGIAAILLLVAIVCVCKKKITKSAVIIFMSSVASAVLYFIQYQLYGKGAVSAGAVGTAVVSIFQEIGVFIKGFLVYNGSTVLGYSVWIDNVIPVHIYMLVGLFITFLYGYAIFLFFSTKMYKKTLVPMLFVFYTFAIFAMVAISRSHHWTQFVGSWYQVHTKPGAISIVWIWLYAYKQTDWPKNARMKWIRNWSKGLKVATNALCVVLVGFVFFGNLVTVRRAPYVKSWLEAFQPYLFLEPEDMPVDEYGNTPLLNSEAKTNEGIEIMKKYRLSIYRYYHAYEQAEEMMEAETVS